jgi:dihydroflavonol-4-reductase
VPRLAALNVDSVRNVVAALPEGARLVHVSSVAAIGPAPSRDRPATEDQAWPAHASAYPYPASKRAGEQVALAAAAAGRDVVVANPAFVIGAGDVNRSSTFAVWRYLQGSLRIHTPGGLSYVHVDDVAAGLVAAAERGRAGERYALANRDGNLSHEDFFRRVGEVTGVRRRMLGLPPRLALAGATLVPWPVKPGEVRAAANWWFYDQAKAERELGYVNRPLDETIAETAAYLRSR